MGILMLWLRRWGRISGRGHWPPVIPGSNTDCWSVARAKESCHEVGTILRIFM